MKNKTLKLVTTQRVNKFMDDCALIQKYASDETVDIIYELAMSIRNSEQYTLSFATPTRNNGALITDTNKGEI